VDGGGDQSTGGEPAEGESEAGTTNMRLACIRHSENSLLTIRHSGGVGGVGVAGGAGGAGGAASSEATTHMS
jgi:hypothetical protein